MMKNGASVSVLLNASSMPCIDSNCITVIHVSGKKYFPNRIANDVMKRPIRLSEKKIITEKV